MKMIFKKERVRRETKTRKPPKFKCFPNSHTAIRYFRYWFDNITLGRSNTFMVAICAKGMHNNKETYGLAFTADSVCSIYFETANDFIQLNDSLAHEVGHRFSLLNINMGGFSAHVDNEGNYIHDHSKKDYYVI